MNSALTPPAPEPAPDRPIDGAGSDPRVRVVLAVRHDLMRSAVSVLLAASAVVSVVEEVSDEEGAAARLGDGRVDVLVLDRRLPDGASPASIRRLRELAPAVGIVIVSMAVSTAVVSAAIGAGATGYVLKDAADGELIDAVLAVARGDCYVSQGVAARFDAQARADQLQLGETELAVLGLLARGVTDQDVARRLGISRVAVELSRAAIYSQLGLASRADLARYALREGILGGD